jgi:predicted AlkP superfamily pyrophosphatase or phosphodiesterase
MIPAMRRMIRGAVPALVLVAAVLAACAGPPGADRAAPATPAAPRHVVLVSIDGLRPEFYLDPAFSAPTLRALAAAGSFARAAVPVFPTTTYPNHATLVTGVRPNRHGVFFNIRFEPDGSRGRWYDEAADLKAPALWTWAHAAGLRTASVNWPSTHGAPIDLLVPDRLYPPDQQALDRLVAGSTPGLLARARATPSLATFEDPVAWDALATQVATGILREARPRLLLLHLVQTDDAQHRRGRDAAEVKQAVARVDGHVALIRAALREAGIADRTAVIVTGDHGFENVPRQVFVNYVLKRAGLRGCPALGAAWRATAHVTGGSAAIFVNPPGDAQAARDAEAALRSTMVSRYTIVSRAELDALGAMAGAAFAVEAAPGYEASDRCEHGMIGPGSGGQHGFLPSLPTMATGFIAAGDGVRSGVALESMRLVDVAPTVARLLGVNAPAVDGRILTEILAP